MKKLLTTAAAALFICTASAHADEASSGEEQIPMKYLEINQKCENSDIEKYNLCLKDALLEIMNGSFTDEQIEDLKKQLDGIEKQVAEAEPDYSNPLVKEIEGNEAKIKEFRAENMNLIWKRLLIETLNSLKKAMEAEPL